MNALALAACLVFAAPARSQDWAKTALEASPRHSEWVKLDRGDRKLDVFVAYPEVKKRAPVVLLIHEIFGLTDWVRLQADELAAAGYIAVAPDLLSGFGPKGGGSRAFPSVDDARRAVSGLDQAIVAGDLNAAADYALALPSASGKLAAGGFCWGGGQTFRFATLRKGLAAAFVFYGPAPSEPAAAQAPVYGFYGEKDARISAAVPDVAAAMKAAKKRFEPVVYPGAGHGFMRTGESPEGSEADKKARAAAWKRLLAALKKL